jgi:hypothetical protein
MKVEQILSTMNYETALIKSLKEPEDKIGGNKFSHLSLEDFK